MNFWHILGILTIVGVVIVLTIGGYILGWFGEAAKVAKEEFGPEASLEKYEWFKETGATLQEKKRTIEVYENNVKEIEADYEGIKRIDWDRTDKEQINQWRLEVAGLKASFNQTAAEYNAASDEFNWKPYKTDIPKEYESYLTE